jgi:hypothetical protein
MWLHLGFRTEYFNKYPTKGPTPLYLGPFYGSGVRFFGAQAGQWVLLKGKEEISFCMDKSGTQTKANIMFQEIKSFVEKVWRPARIWTSWISETTWQMIDGRAAIRKNYKSQCIIVRRLSRRIAKAIKADRKQRTKNAGEAIEYMLKRDNLKWAWSALNAWYKHADGRGSKPSRDDLDKLEAEYNSLYRRGNPPGDPVPVLVAPFYVDDGVPLEGEIADTVRRMRNGKAPGPSGIRVEHLKEWLVLSEREQDPDGSKWGKVYELIQHVFLLGDFPTELLWSVLEPIPKGSGGFRGIGLL